MIEGLALNIPTPPAFLPLLGGQRYQGAKGGRGGAKCLGRGTNVVMFDGSLKAVETVAVGDLLLGLDGMPRRVLNVTSGTDDLYRVKQLVGNDYVVNGSHILALIRRKSARLDCGTLSAAGNPQRINGRYAKYGDDPSLISVDEFAAKSERFKCHFFGFKAPATFAAKSLPLDPYFLGLWLGDGSCDQPTITTMDPEIVDCIHEVAAQHGMRVTERRKPHNRAASYAICRHNGTAQENILTGKLRALDVICNKHIPFNYRCGDETQRLALLAGLIDTDGAAHHNGYHISQSRRRLLDDAKFVADSLGFKTSLVRRDSKCKGEWFEAWHLSITGDAWRIPCRIARKQFTEAGTRKNKDWRRTRIDIEPIGTGEYFGFELDGDHLFFLDDFTVTHNSHFFGEQAVEEMFSQHTRLACVREIQNSIKDSVKQLIEDKIYSLCATDVDTGKQWPIAPWFKVTEREIVCPHTDSLGIFRGLQNHTAASIKSLEGFNRAWYEESQTLTQRSLDLATPTFRDTGAQQRFSWNPEFPDDPVDRMFRENMAANDPDFSLVTVNFEDNPWFPAGLRADMERDKLRDADKYNWIWRGGYRQNSEAQVFHNWKVERFERPDRGTALYGGGDWGFSVDPTVGLVCFIVGRTLYIWREVWALGCEIDRTPALFDKLDPDWTPALARDPNWKSLARQIPIVADSARPETISYMQRNGFPRMVAAIKGPGSVEDGVTFLQSYDIVVHPDCVHTIDELKLYSYKIDKKTGKVTVDLEDKNNHCIDGCRYSIESVRRARTSHRQELR